VLFEAGDVTEELLDALFSLRTFELRDHHDCTRIKTVAALARLRDAFAAKAALILKIIWVDFGHTI
jgi:hypothetical protein